VIREVREETGLTITDVVPAGYIQWYNPDRQSQYFFFLFKASSYSGDLKGSSEGNVKWMTLDEMLSGKLAPNMKQYLAVFQNENIPQAYGMSDKTLRIIGTNGKENRQL
jgi:8-oxo-dGTP diphosphatase